MDVIHTAIWVSDLEAARTFFVDALGLDEHWSFTMDGVENVYVGGEHGEIQLRYDPERGDPTPDRDALDHVAVSVDDVTAETERVVAATDCEVLEGPMRVEAADTKVSFIEGPDGYVVELVEDRG
ncbi:VOC family protein [Halococcus saccharolyticus]|uniref:Glyoxalase/bleomycin resistance protein/dioxygenase n=1 Tax=Halococcus saccharolyticus DSM 5350 TaxID=1227455 RepID=M0MKY0_9EURY|nr:VOC family protein [Halococcus saccharolyticus]EMA45085.1 glyoxalase/bleomycin resistance protein/dioxygenase [Halococcus saccharolyticus DSM 5350]